ncbi:regulator [Micromonospora sp. HSS6-12]|uniref:Regulator n=2 Tax=Micromonospora thermarum TaxID=2720024 RepID=A0ABX0ZCD7_9ACTN|nr:regulator [Micromonospora thermarum]
MHDSAQDDVTTMTFEAFADTILPGEKRFPGDVTVAGVAVGGGAVASGAVAVLRTDEGGMAPALDNLAEALNGHAGGYAAERGLSLDPAVPPFVALSFADRTELVARLTAPTHPERDIWVSVAMFSTIAFDAAAHLHTVDALADGHPGMTTMGFKPPEADGLWRFPEFSYGRQLARPHPDTTPSGSPA